MKGHDDTFISHEYVKEIIARPPLNSTTDHWVDEDVGGFHPDLGHVLDSTPPLSDILKFQFVKSLLPDPFCKFDNLPDFYMEFITSVRGLHLATHAMELRKQMKDMIVSANAVDNHLTVDFKRHLDHYYPTVTSSLLRRLEAPEKLAEVLASFLIDDMVFSPSSESFVNLYLTLSPVHGAKVGGFVIWRFLSPDCGCWNFIDVQYIFLHPRLRGTRRAAELLLSTKIDISRAAANAARRVASVSTDVPRSIFSDPSDKKWKDRLLRLQKVRNGWFFRAGGTSLNALLVSKGGLDYRVQYQHRPLILGEIEDFASCPGPLPSHETSVRGMAIMMDNELFRRECSSFERLHRAAVSDDWRSIARDKRVAQEKLDCAKQERRLDKLYLHLVEVTYHWNVERLWDCVDLCQDCSVKPASTATTGMNRRLEFSLNK